jgi:hypothetical protein
LEASASTLIAAVLDVLALATGRPFHKNVLLKEENLSALPFRRCLSTKGSSAETTEEIHILRRSVSNRPEHSIESPLENGLLAGHRLPSLGHWKKRVAEKPEKLVVYDGTGAGQGVWMWGARSGARDW